MKASRHYNYSTRSYVQDLSAASIDGKTVTLKAALRDLNYQTNGLSYSAKEGDAEWANGSLSAVSPTGMGTLKAIDGKDASDNQPVYTMETANIVLSYTAKPAGKSNSARLTADEIENLKENTFRLHFVENNSTSVVEIPLGDLNIGGTLLRDLQGNKKTWTNFAAALRSAIKAKIDTTKYTVGGSNAAITVTQAKANVDKNSRTYFYTDVQTGTVSEGEDAKELGRWTSTGVNPFTVTQVKQGAPEQPEICKVDIANLSGQLPLSFSVNGTTHLYYNPNDPADWLGRIDRADLAISSARGTIGADYNRLEHTIQDLSNAHIQLTDAYSVIRDADMAELMKEEIKLQILMQAQQSMQAQANQMPQGVLQLLQ